MRRNLSAQLNMFGAVINFSDANESSTTSIAAYGTALGLLKTSVTNINATAEKAALIIKGITANKVSLKSQVSVSANTISAAIYSYAASLSDPNLDLEGQSDFCLSDFKSKKDRDLVTMAQNIYTLANELVTVIPPATNPLSPYNITATTLSDFQTEIDNYSDTISGPRSAIAVRKSYNLQLKILFKKSVSILKRQLDKNALLLAASNPQFYDAYLAARKIVGSNVNHTKISGIVMDGRTTAPLVGATVKAQNTLVETQTTTDENGHYILYTPKFKLDHTVTATMPGYQTLQVSSVSVKLGKTTTKDMVMNPVG